jgi:Uma2 family endonuclease
VVSWRVPGDQEADHVSVSTPRSKSVPPSEPIDRNRAIPPLKDGDRLTLDEFMRRYEAMPDLKKAELIEGVVYVPSPVSQENHGDQLCSLTGLIFLYRARTPGLKSGDNCTVRLDLNNSPQPDVVLFIESAHGGQVKLDEKGYIVGAPDLVAEVAASTVRYDLHDKLRAYERNGVREYIIWRVLEHTVDWFVLRDQGFEKLSPDEDGAVRSTIFPGLWLDVSALLRDDFGKVLDVLQSGIDSPEHAEFVADLRQAAGNKSRST